MATNTLSVVGSHDILFTSTTTRYWAVVGVNNASTTESVTKLKSNAGTYSKLLVKILTNSVNATSNTRLRKNGANGNQVCSIGNNATGVFQDTTNTDTFADGDDINFSHTNGATGTIEVQSNSVQFDDGSNDGLMLLGVTCVAGLSTASTTRYLPISNYYASMTSSETVTQHTCRKTIALKRFQVNVNTNARGTASTLKTRKNGADGAFSISVGAGATGQLEDNSATQDSLVSGNTCGFSLTNGTGTGSIAVQYWAVNYISTDETNMLFYAGQHNVDTFLDTNTYYIHPYGRISMKGTTELEDFIVKPNLSGVLNTLQYRVSSNSVSAASTGLIRNNGSDTSISVSIGSSATGLFEDTTNTSDYTSGNAIVHKLTTGVGGTSLASPYIAFYLTKAPLVRTLDESYNVTDTVARAQTLVRTLTDTYNVTESVARVIAFTRALGDTYDVTDSVTRAQVLTRLLTDSYNVDDVIARAQTLTRVLTDNYDVTDSVQIDVSSGSHEEDLPESYNVQDTINRLVAFTRTLTDNYDVTDSVARAQTLTRAISENYDVTDTLTVEVNHIKNISENYDVTDTLQTSQILTRQIQESYDVQDAVTRLVALLRTLTDNYDVQDNVARALVLLRSISENYDVTDTINRLVSFQRLLTDTYDDLDTITRSQVLTRLLTDTFDVTDSVIAGKTFIKELTDNYDVADTLNKLQDLARQINENYNVVDNLERMQQLTRELADTYDVTDIVTKIKETSILLNENYDVTDVVNKLQQLARVVTDTYNVSENVIRQALLNRTVTDTYDVTDIVEAEIAGDEFFADLTESYDVTESVSISQILTRLLTEAYDVADTVQKIGGDVIIIDEGIKPSGTGGGGSVPYDMSRLKKKIISRTIGDLIPEAFPDTIKIDNQKAWFLNDKLENEEPNKPFRQITKLNSIKATIKINNPKQITRKYNTILANVKTRKQLKLEQEAYRHIELLEQNKISTQEFIDKIPNEIRYYNYRDGKILNYKSINNIKCGLKVNNKKNNNRKVNNIKANLILNKSINISIDNKATAPLKLVYKERYTNNIIAPLKLRQISKFNTAKADLILSNNKIQYNVFKAKVLDSKKHITKKLGTLLLKKTQLTYDVIMKDILHKSKSDQKEHLLYKLQTYQTRFNVERTKTNTEMRKLERKYKKPLMELYTKIAEEYKDDLPHFQEARIKYNKEAHDILRSVANKAYNLGIEYVSKAAQKEDIFITETDIKNVKNRTDEAITHFFDSVEKHIKSKQYYNDVWNLKPSEQIEEQTQNMSNVPFIDLPSEEIRPVEEAQKKTEIVEQVPSTEEQIPKPYPIEDSVILLLNALSTGLVALGTFSKLYQIQDIFNQIGIQTKLVYVTEYDDRVCPKCIIYDYRINGISYDIDDYGFVPRPPIHFRCRCRLLLKIGEKIISK